MRRYRRNNMSGRTRKLMIGGVALAIAGGAFAISTGVSSAGENCAGLDQALRQNLQFIAGQRANPDSQSAFVSMNFAFRRKLWNDRGSLTVRVADPFNMMNFGYRTANGMFWHRASFDGYGEKNDGSQWEPTDTGSGITHGRGWPLLTGERGEYRLAAGRGARVQLATMARSADNQSWFLPEQVWDHRAPGGTSPRFRPGEPTLSATPLAWTHAQFIRLAWSIVRGTPVETPQPVACRYGSPLCRR